MHRQAASRDVFRAISDPSRRAALDLLLAGDRSAGELGSALGLSPSAVSQHLSILLESGLVSVAPAGRQRIYRLDPRPIREIYDWAQHYTRFWTAKLDALGEHLDHGTM